LEKEDGLTEKNLCGPFFYFQAMKQKKEVIKMVNRDGYRYRLARMQQGLLQVELAKKTKINVSILSQFENGWRIPTPRQLRKLKRVLPRLGEDLGLTR
jgi:ribosome-binding protein aMBF1 (putative translation factor)